MRRILLAVSPAILTALLCATPLFAQLQGEWTSVSNMTSAREFAAAVPLRSGALVIGGSDGTNPLASAEIYSASTGKWKLTGAMATARMLFPAVVLQNGKILVEGGATNSTVLAGAELYNPATGTWSSAGNLAVARAHHTATLLQNGEVLVTGGCTNTSCKAITGVSELYDPAMNKWTTVGSLNQARYYHTATLLNNGKVLVVGGYVPVVTTSSELYDPATGTWSVGPGISTRYKHAATLLPDGTVLITGGVLGSSAFYETAIYDPATNSWKSTGFLTLPHFSHNATLLTNGTVLVSGGANAYYVCGYKTICPYVTKITEI